MNQQLIHHVPFHEETLLVVEDSLGDRFVVMKPIVEALGLSWVGQLQRIKRDDVLSTCMCVTHMQIPGDDQAREVTALPIELFHGWLFTIDASRVKPEAKDKLIAYKMECFDVLHSYFTEGAAWNPRFHRQEFDRKAKHIAGKQALDMAPVAFSAVSRAAERVRAHDVVAFTAKALDLANQCLQPGEHDKHLQEHLIKFILDTGETLHPDEVSALTRTTPSQRSALLRRINASGYTIYKTPEQQYARWEQPILGSPDVSISEEDEDDY